MGTQKILNRKAKRDVAKNKVKQGDTEHLKLN